MCMDRPVVAIIVAFLSPLLGACPPSATRVMASPAVLQERTESPGDSVFETRQRLISLLEFVDASGRPSRSLPLSLAPVLRSHAGLARDAWGHEFTYVRQGLHFELRSPGPDARLNTADDIVMSGQLGRNIPCETRVGGRIVRYDDLAPPCAADAEVVVLPPCARLDPIRYVTEPTPSSRKDSLLLTGRRLVRFARGVDYEGRARGGLPPTVRSVPGYPRVGDGWEFADAWDRPVRYTPREKTFEMRSMGPDGTLGTPDDVVVAAELGRTIPCQFQSNSNVFRCGDPPPPCLDGPEATTGPVAWFRRRRRTDTAG